MAVFKIEINDEILKELDESRRSEVIRSALFQALGMRESEHVTCHMQDPATPDEVAEARDQYADEELEIDEDALTSRADADDGLWVSAWVWLSRTGSVFITDNKAEKRIEVSQSDTDSESLFPYDDTPDSRNIAIHTAQEEADAMIEGYAGAKIYDETSESADVAQPA